MLALVRQHSDVVSRLESAQLVWASIPAHLNTVSSRLAWATTETLFQKIKSWTVAQWYSACLACTKSSV
jgi:hypothetical protein